jgi:undecaprenyl pyrophosphate phosphatase UppP
MPLAERMHAAPDLSGAKFRGIARLDRARFARAIGGLGSDPVARRFALNLAIAFLPAATLGFLFGSAIQATLFRPVPVAIAFVAGAFVILWAERRQRLDMPPEAPVGE